MNKIESAIQKYVIAHYGDLIVPAKPQYNERKKIWEAQLRSAYPRIIEDDESKERIVRFLDLNNLGIIRINDELQVIDATPEEKCEHQLAAKIDSWRIQSEQIVIRASSDAFAKIAEGEHVLHPLIVLLHRLLSDGKAISISEEEIDSQHRSGKIREYIRLLEELGIILKINNAYTYGDTYVGILEQAKIKGLEPQTALISHVIERKYSSLKQVFGILQLEPYVQLANSFYWPSLDAEQLVRMTRDNLKNRLREFYGKRFAWGFDFKLSQLIKGGAITEDKNGFLTGDETRFESMLVMKRTSRRVIY